MAETSNRIKVAVRLADGTKITGMLNIGRYNRLSDCLNSKDAGPFLIIYEASTTDTNNNVVMINRDHVAWAAPE